MKEKSSVEWPPVTYEQRPWNPLDDVPLSRRQRLAHRGPYMAAVVPEVAATELHLPSSIIALAEDAAQELARFDAEAGSMVAPFTAILLRTESASSSQIENLTSSAKQVALAELGLARSRNAEMVVANVNATMAAVRLSEDIDEAAIIAMHAALLEGQQPAMVGRWRQEQVWIGGSKAGPHNADFVPPHHELVPAAMRDLVRFMERDDLPYLPQIALAHAQFETIHPFPDGNGRTGRALVQALLRHKGLTRSMTVPISAGLLTDVPRYFSALTAYREGNAGPILMAFSDAALEAVVNGRELHSRLVEIDTQWRAALAGVRADAAAWKLLSWLLSHPVIDASSVAVAIQVSLPTTYAAIDELEKRSIVRPEKAGAKRNQVWFAPDLLAALDEFAERARRGRA